MNEFDKLYESIIEEGNDKKKIIELLKQNANEKFYQASPDDSAIGVDTDEFDAGNHAFIWDGGNIYITLTETDVSTDLEISDEGDRYTMYGVFGKASDAIKFIKKYIKKLPVDFDRAEIN